MHDLIPYDEAALSRSPSVVALEEDVPPLGELFAFMAEAELRFQSLRMRIVDRTASTRGESEETLEVTIRDPGEARVTRRRGESGLSRDYDVWVTDGEMIRTLDAKAGSGSIRPIRNRVQGATHKDLPPFARIRPARTILPADTLADMFVHPSGFCRNVLSTGAVAMIGTARLAGDRAAFMIRCDHPKTAHLLTDRPDHWLEVGVDRMTGIVLLLIEHVGDQVTRHAEVVDLEIDPAVPDDAFTIHYSSDIRMLY